MRGYRQAIFDDVLLAGAPPKLGSFRSIEQGPLEVVLSCRALAGMCQPSSSPT
jgi:hypothetical protein